MPNKGSQGETQHRGTPAARVPTLPLSSVKC